MKIFRHIKSLTVAALALALLCVVFASTTKAQAATVANATGVTATYDPTQDKIVIDAQGLENGTAIAVYTCKDATTALTDKDAKKPAVTVTVTGGAATISLSEKKTGVGIKVAENKPVYLFITVASGAAVADKAANFKLAATAVKKIKSATFDYTKAYEGNTEFAIVVKYEKEGVDAEQTATAENLVIGDIRGKDKTPGAYYTGTEDKAFTGGVLYTLITDTEKKNGKDASVKHKLNLQILGSATSVTVDSVVYDGQRNAKVKAVSPKAAAKAPTAKVDHVKGTIALKSGFDFVVRTTETTPSAIAADAWETVLPYAEDGTANSYFMSSLDYKYYKKIDSEVATSANYFTKKGKLKAVDLNEICSKVWASEDVVSGTAIIYVRKTATDKAPASQVSAAIKVVEPAAAPVATSGTAIALADAKGKLAKGAITGANPGGAYEILVVKANLINKIDMTKVKWTKYDATKTFKTKLSSKISYTDSTPAETVSALDEDGKPVAGVVILLRGAGIKEKKGSVGYLATKYAQTRFVLEGTGDSAKIKWEFVPQE